MATLLRLGRAAARRTAAAELAKLAAADGPGRASRLSGLAPARRDLPVLSASVVWERLTAEHWTSLPLFSPDHFYGFFARVLARRRSTLGRALDAFVAHGPSAGAAGGAETSAVLGTTTAPTADLH